ncbi:MAG: hypothetical protein MUC58_04330 [Rhizobiaceae bacterium]|jgi:hypothetical protein|nr:hypothetical protein [Rhizobiaceae bacterium]
MFRRTDIAMIALMIGVVAYTYTVKNGTKDAAQELAKLQRQVDAELNAIDVLNADWSVLTAPARIQSLVEVHNAQLDLHPLDTKRIIAITDIPERPAPPPEDSIDDILARYGDVDASLTTGSVLKPGQSLEPVLQPLDAGQPLEGDQ